MTAPHRRTRLGRGWRFIVSAAFIGLSACGGSDWAAVDSAVAVSPDATRLVLGLDYCDVAQNPAPADNVIESPTEVCVRLDIPIPSDDCDDHRSGPGSGEARGHGGPTRRYGWVSMMNRHRRHLLPAVALAATAALMATGCSGGDTDSDADTTEAAVSDATTLDGVRIDVRRDPG